MANAIWKGQISFGLLNVPVTLFSGEKRSDIQFHMIDSRDCNRVRYERVNEETGEEVPWNQIVKGFEYDKGNYVVIDKKDLKQVMPEASQMVEVEAFVDLKELSPLFFEKPYYLVPAKKFEKGYVLLREALKETGTVGIAKVVIRTRQYLAALMPQDNAIVLNLLRFAQELREADEFELPGGSAKDYKISPKELDMSKQLIDAMKSEWRPQDYHDEYRDNLMKYIESKMSKGKVKPSEEEVPDTTAGTGNVVDMMALLKQSLESRSQKSQQKPAARKSSAAKSTTAKRKSTA